MNFEEKLRDFIPELTRSLRSFDNDDWSVKGFIDCYQNIYSISNDTKVISKIIELMVFPKFVKFAKENDLLLELAPHQNYYPDITFIDKNGKKYAVDLKSTYRISSKRINGMTLGAFTGYFRDRKSLKNTHYAYGSYEKHYVLGVIYSRKELQSEMMSYTLENFNDIESVATNFDFFLQEKWKIAIDRAGSGNTKNIGSEREIAKLKEGKGIFFREFEENGEEFFDHYWMNYLTKDMARSLDMSTPLYNNLQSYKAWIDSVPRY